MIRFSIALGFTSRNRDAEPVVLYAGKSFEEAKAAMTSPPPEIVYAVAIKNPAPNKKWVRPITGEVADLPAVDEVPAPHLELLPEPEPVAKKKAKAAAESAESAD